MASSSPFVTQFPTPYPPKIPTISSSSSDDSENNDDEEEETSSRHGAIEETIFRAYLQVSGRSTTDLSKIHNFLAASRTGAIACLICLERTRPADPVWSCSAGCFAVFHLFCIQNWARQASNLAAERALARLSRDHFPLAASAALESSNWHCPKCRVEYPQTLIPRLYFCFCGKVESPPSDPWILPHSCGEICGRLLKGDCGHRCLLLCHPGPCPPCPKLLKNSCFCGSVKDVRRCGQRGFSCNGACSRVLGCGLHRCREMCHQGPCPPCREKATFRCRCGKVEEERECFECEFRCESPCGRELDCEKHACGRGCHSGPCGQCPLQGKKSCPCGKREHKGLACDAAVPTCGSTCEKMLNCGLHSCPERCHRGPCIDTCRIVVTKICRCGSLKRQVPCYQDLVCERKCHRVRDCGRHACKRRCCDGDCPPCSEICGRKLRCNNHKCPSPCHRGACVPCPLMVSISCSCGETRFEVPCGIEKEQKPPRCPKPCRVSTLCRHGSKCKPHKCHYGACPPCRLICEEMLPCGHTCKLRCHGPKPPPNPEFTLKSKKKKSNPQTNSSDGSPCPPCQEILWKPCLGKHIGAEQLTVCSDRRTFSCQNLCGNLLQCGNHYCEKPCHAIATESLTMDLQEIDGKFPNQVVSESCEECDLPCQKERKPVCPHPCPLSCHSGDCLPCQVLIKRACHCGAMVHAFECTYFNSLLEEEQQKIRSCGGPCHRKLPNCTHLCPEVCHPGQCPSPEKCCKKVTVRCACQNLKKEWLCQDVQAAYRNANQDFKHISKNQFGHGLLLCNSDCMRTSKQNIVDHELHSRKTTVTESKKKEHVYVPKRKKRRDRMGEITQISKFQEIIAKLRRWILFVLVVVVVVAGVYYGSKGLFWLSDWMNEVEERRLTKRYPRI